MSLFKRLNSHGAAMYSGAFLALVLGASSMTRAATPALLVGADLQPQRVTIQGLSDGTLTYFDTQRRLQSEPASRFVQIRFVAGTENATRESSPTTAPATQPAGAISIELTDGQRLVGPFVDTIEQGQKLRVRVGSEAAAWMAVVPLEQVRVLAWNSPAPAPGISVNMTMPEEESAAASDRVVLSNGDRIEGFVTELSEKGLTLRLAGESAGQSTLPLDRLARVQLNNPRIEAASNQAVVRWKEGMALRGSDVRIGVESGQNVLRFRPALANDEAMSCEVPVSVLSAVDLNSRVGRLVSLADLPMKVTGGGTLLGLSAAPVARRGALELHAPVTLRVELPAGTTRLSAIAELALPADVSPAARAWADVNLSLKQGQTTLADLRLNSQQPMQAINAPLEVGASGGAGGELFIVVDPGVNGPVLDRVRLREAMVLVRRK